MTPDILKKFAGAVPRYTSYPTAPHFSAEVGPERYASWLAELSASTPLSLYVHVPYCDTLCWYCGCNTKMVRRYDPVAAYARALIREIDHVAGRLGPAREVSHLHWGGGSPNILSADDILKLSVALRSYFKVREDAEFAVEIDPRTLDDARITAFALAGVNRVSIGVQDFAEKVQQAINRQQSYETTKRAVSGFRAHGIASVNVDLVYGLPYQTRASAAETIEQVLTLAPDRIALFGYAHLPARLPHQRMIPDDSLPDTLERFAIANRMASRLTDAGYIRIGLDHFAWPDDALARGTVRRNFQGYTTDACQALIGLGASSIGQLPQGYVQNATATSDYIRRVAGKGLATAKGYVLSDDDRARAFAIERLMCDLRFPAGDLKSRFGETAAPLLEEARTLISIDTDGLIAADADGFHVTERGRPFLRSICSAFDAYLGASPARHSAGV